MNGESKDRHPIITGVSSLLKSVSKFLEQLRNYLYLLRWGIDFLRLKYLDFVPRPDDVFIITYPRSGTTWMQMILYQLTTEGRMDFQHISQVCPWFERAALTERNLDLEKMSSPRIFKTHLSCKLLPKGGKCIYVTRNVKDVAVSYYHFYVSHFRYEQSFSEFFELFLQGKVTFGSWFKHVADWRSHQNDAEILFLNYEDLLNDLEGCLHKIVAFCHLDVAPERLPEIVERCSFDFMKKHESKFDFAGEKLLEEGIAQRAFIRQGKVNTGKNYFTSEQEELLKQELGKYRDKLGTNFSV